jgi:hypothetical protein
MYPFHFDPFKNPTNFGTGSAKLLASLYGTGTKILTFETSEIQDIEGVMQFPFLSM